MKLEFFPYELHPFYSLNREQDEKPKSGLLLRFRDKNEDWTYTDCFPLLERKDDPVERQLLKWRQGEPTDLIKRALQRAHWLDREISPSALERLNNHFLAPSILNLSKQRLSELRARGFKTLKIKMGRNLLEETMALEKLVDSVSGLKVRLDFNQAFRFDDFLPWYKNLSDPMKSSLEFIEDPTPFSSKHWKEWQDKYDVPLAVDEVQDPENLKAGGFSVLVLKPARQNCARWLDVLSGQSFGVVFTHSMDHGLGRWLALQEALYWVEKGLTVLDCGLLGVNLYANDFLTEFLDESGPKIKLRDSFQDFIGRLKQKLNALHWQKMGESDED